MVLGPQLLWCWRAYECLSTRGSSPIDWPNITVKREPPPDAKEWEGKPDKVNLLSPNLWGLWTSNRVEFQPNVIIE
jgi:Domain of unknown function (DUF3470)